MNDIEQLLPALRLGDPDAFTALEQNARAIIRHAINRYIRCEEDVEELVSDTLVRAHRKLATFRGDCSLRTWLYRIACNLAKNRYHYWNRRHRATTLSLDFTVFEGDQPLHAKIPSEEIDHRDGLEIDEIEKAYRESLSLLSPRHREIMELLVDDHLDYQGIAERLNINFGTVKSRIARARVDLRRAMAEKLEAA